MKKLSMLLMFVLPMTMASHYALAQEVTITLNPGWTWVSYPRADTLDVTTALQSIPPTEGDIIKSQTAFATYVYGQWFGTLQQLIPGKGLMYRSLNPNQVSFIFGAEPEAPTPPTGAINGLFTINANGNQVYFSQGNLQYIGSAATPYWKFADYQWDCIGYTQTGSSQTIDRDLFGWGISGYSHGAICYQPWSTSENYYEYFAYGSGLFNLSDQTGQADWGYNAIINGGNQENQWRTLTNDEWIYLIDTRNTDSGIRWALAIVNGCGGAILLPDNWDASTYYLNNVNGGSFYSNAIPSEVWINVFEPNGAVFLPGNAGTRFGIEWADGGGYWSSTYSNGVGVYYSHIGAEHVYSSNDFGSRHYGRSVRLVRPAN
jgi:hypothetical protein